MALFKKVDRVLAALGNMKAMERLHVDTVTEEKMENVGGEKIAESDQGVLFGGIEELNGYLFLETILLSKSNLKTFKGATISFEGDDSFQLKSDTQEIESDFSNVSNRFMTRVSFDITEEDIERIKNGSYDSLVYTCKKTSLVLARPKNNEVE